MITHWLPMLGEVAAAAALTAAALLARRDGQRRAALRFQETRVNSWENEGGSLVAATR